MYPVLTVLHWGGITRAIGSYGVLLALALLVGCAITLRAGQRAGLEGGALISTLAGAVGSGFAGAYLAQFALVFAQTASLEASLQQPGIMFYGGAVGGALGLAGFARVFGLPVARTLDLALPGLPIAHAIGRLGCWFGGCCYGAVSNLPWSVVYQHPLAPGAHPALPRHPWPLYEATGLLVLAAVFARFGTAAAPGRRAAAYVLSYAGLRFALEPWRGDAARGVFLHGSIAQGIALASAALAFGWLVRERRRSQALCGHALPV